MTNVVARSQTVAQTAPGTRPLFRPLSEFEAPVQVFADKATNSIIVSSTKSAYTKLQSVIRDLDARRKQVFVEAVILEVQVDRLKQIGSDPVQVIAAGSSGSVQGIAGFNLAPENLSSLAAAIIGSAAGASATGGASLLNTVNVRAFLQLLLSLTDTNVISTPKCSPQITKRPRSSWVKIVLSQLARPKESRAGLSLRSSEKMSVSHWNHPAGHGK